MKLTDGALWVRQAQEDREARLHDDTFIIWEGTTLHISYLDHVPYLIRIPIWGEGMHSDTGIPSVWWFRVILHGISYMIHSPQAHQPAAQPLSMGRQPAVHQSSMDKPQLNMWA